MFFGPGYDAAEAMGVLPWLTELSYAVSEALCVTSRAGAAPGSGTTGSAVS
ncbi:hypothetical protein GCM10010510_62370 [Streptomyces anandii JCM 4720]|nr:hypothetical protein GCM10010510_62370 [Streptomyces anandii JCM 4720]